MWLSSFPSPSIERTVFSHWVFLAPWLDISLQYMLGFFLGSQFLSQNTQLWKPTCVFRLSLSRTQHGDSWSRGNHTTPFGGKDHLLASRHWREVIQGRHLIWNVQEPAYLGNRDWQPSFFFLSWQEPSLPSYLTPASWYHLHAHPLPCSRAPASPWGELSHIWCPRFYVYEAVQDGNLGQSWIHLFETISP